MAHPIRATVEAWKSRPLRHTDIPLEAACARINSPNRLFEARRTGPVEWVLCRAGEDVPAIFSYAAIFASSDPVETGNLMDPEEDKNAISETSRLERNASFKCNYSYSFDTSQDPGLFGTQFMIDTYMETVPGFNLPQRKPRRVWQSGSGPSGTNRFWMRVPMFLKLRDNEWKGEPPEHLHEWVKEADRRSRNYRANPSRPAVFGYEGRVLKNIAECTPPRLFRGDAVALTFSISYIIGHRDWYPNYALIDVVRIASEGNVPLSAGADNMVVLHPPFRQALRAGEVLEDEGDDWEIEDLPSESRAIPHTVPVQNVSPVKEIHGDVAVVPTREAPERTRSELPSDSMDVDDVGPAAAPADVTGPIVNDAIRGRTMTPQFSRASSSSLSPPTDESLHWSDTAIEEGPMPTSSDANDSVRSEGEEIDTLKSKLRKRRVVYRR